MKRLICTMALLVTSSYAVDTWTDISTTLIDRLAAQGQTQPGDFAYMHGCSGVAVNPASLHLGFFSITASMMDR